MAYKAGSQEKDPISKHPFFSEIRSLFASNFRTENVFEEFSRKILNFAAKAQYWHLHEMAAV
jgi:hypothetical protein